MNRVRTLVPTLFMVMISAGAQASPDLLPGSAPASAKVQPVVAAPTAVSGAYSLTINVKFASPVPTGATIQCKARIAPGLTPFDNQHGTPLPVEKATARIAAHDSSATCLVEVPFSWMVSNLSNGITLVYEVDAVTVSGSAPLHAGQQIGAAYPSPGGTSSMVFNLAF
jgi:hypothetical protein